MVGHRRNAMTMQSLQRSHETGLDLCRVLVSGPRSKVTIFGRRTSGPCCGHKEGPQGHKGSVHPLM